MIANHTHPSAFRLLSYLLLAASLFFAHSALFAQGTTATGQRLCDRPFRRRPAQCRSHLYQCGDWRCQQGHDDRRRALSAYGSFAWRLQGNGDHERIQDGNQGRH